MSTEEQDDTSSPMCAPYVESWLAPLWRSAGLLPLPLKGPFRWSITVFGLTLLLFRLVRQPLRPQDYASFYVAETLGLVVAFASMCYALYVLNSSNSHWTRTHEWLATLHPWSDSTHTDTYSEAPLATSYSDSEGHASTVSGDTGISAIELVDGVRDQPGKWNTIRPSGSSDQMTFKDVLMETHRKSARGALIPLIMWLLYYTGDNIGLHFSGHPPANMAFDRTIWESIGIGYPLLLAVSDWYLGNAYIAVVLVHVLPLSALKQVLTGDRWRVPSAAMPNVDQTDALLIMEKETSEVYKRNLKASAGPVLGVVAFGAVYGGIHAVAMIVTLAESINILKWFNTTFIVLVTIWMSLLIGKVSELLYRRRAINQWNSSQREARHNPTVISPRAGMEDIHVEFDPVDIDDIGHTKPRRDNSHAAGTRQGNGGGGGDDHISGHDVESTTSSSIPPLPDVCMQSDLDDTLSQGTADDGGGDPYTSDGVDAGGVEMATFSSPQPEDVSPNYTLERTHPHEYMAKVVPLSSKTVPDDLVILYKSRTDTGTAIQIAALDGDNGPTRLTALRSHVIAPTGKLLRMYVSLVGMCFVITVPLLCLMCIELWLTQHSSVDEDERKQVWDSGMVKVLWCLHYAVVRTNTAGLIPYLCIVFAFEKKALPKSLHRGALIYYIVMNIVAFGMAFANMHVRFGIGLFIPLLAWTYMSARILTKSLPCTSGTYVWQLISPVMLTILLGALYGFIVLPLYVSTDDPKFRIIVRVCIHGVISVAASILIRYVSNLTVYRREEVKARFALYLAVKFATACIGRFLVNNVGSLGDVVLLSMFITSFEHGSRCTRVWRNVIWRRVLATRVGQAICFRKETRIITRDSSDTGPEYKSIPLVEFLGEALGSTSSEWKANNDGQFAVCFMVCEMTAVFVTSLFTMVTLVMTGEHETGNIIKRAIGMIVQALIIGLGDLFSLTAEERFMGIPVTLMYRRHGTFVLTVACAVGLTSLSFLTSRFILAVSQI